VKFTSLTREASPTIDPLFLTVIDPGVTIPPEIISDCLVQYRLPFPAEVTKYKSEVFPVYGLTPMEDTPT